MAVDYVVEERAEGRISPPLRDFLSGGFEYPRAKQDSLFFDLGAPIATFKSRAK